MWQGVGCLTIGCGGYRLVCWVRRAEVSGGMDNDHSQERRVIQHIWGVPCIQPWCARQGLGLVVQCSLPQCQVWQQPNTKPHNNNNNKNSNHLRITKVLIKTISLCIQIISLGTVE